jgi:hypothetical protein
MHRVRALVGHLAMVRGKPTDGLATMAAALDHAGDSALSALETVRKRTRLRVTRVQRLPASIPAFHHQSALLSRTSIGWMDVRTLLNTEEHKRGAM